MSLAEHVGNLALAASSPVSFVLDASASATACQPEATYLVTQALGALPAGLAPELFFLGNPKSYSIARFSAHAADWFTQNRGRASLISPVFEQLDDGRHRTVVIVSDGRIFDLEDWIGTPLLQSSILVLLAGESPLAGLDLRVLARPSDQELSRYLHDPVIDVSITGPAFMPYGWSNPGLRSQFVDGRLTLSGQKLADFSTSLAFFAQDAFAVSVKLRRASGVEETVGLALQSDPLGPTTSEPRRLSVAERELFQRASHRQSIKCLHCGQDHQWDTVYCRPPHGGFSRIIYPTLEEISGFVLRDEDTVVTFWVHEPGVLRLNRETVALRDGRSALVYHHDSQSGWTPVGPLLAYQPLENDTYAMVI